jgi:hypothetical protein
MSSEGKAASLKCGAAVAMKYVKILISDECSSVTLFFCLHAIFAANFYIIN